MADYIASQNEIYRETGGQNPGGTEGEKSCRSDAAGLRVRPYQTTVPSFGVWGFALARLHPFAPPARVPLPLRYLDAPTLAGMFVFPPDMDSVPVEINRLDNQMLVRYYEEEWKKWS